jgi:hypothetical protein
VTTNLRVGDAFAESAKKSLSQEALPEEGIVVDKISNEFGDLVGFQPVGLATSCSRLLRHW